MTTVTDERVNERVDPTSSIGAFPPSELTTGRGTFSPTSTCWTDRVAASGWRRALTSRPTRRSRRDTSSLGSASRGRASAAGRAAGVKQGQSLLLPSSPAPTLPHLFLPSSSSGSGVLRVPLEVGSQPRRDLLVGTKVDWLLEEAEPAEL